MQQKINPLISIVMPSYNHGKFISKSIDSILNQTYTNWELLIIDNNSTDETIDVLKKYKSEKRINVFYVNNEGSIGYSRNIGLNKAKSDYIAFIDSDDLWSSTKLKECICYLKNYDFIFHDVKIKFLSNFKKSIIRLPVFYNIENNTLKTLLLSGNPIVNSSVITKKSLLIKVGGIDETKEINRSVDFNTWLKIAAVTNRFKHLKKVLGENLIHENNLSLQNMMPSTKSATEQFIHLLSKREKKQYQSRLFFIDFSHKFHSKNYNEIEFKKIYFSINHGLLEIKLKSIVILILTRIKLFLN